MPVYVQLTSTKNSTDTLTASFMFEITYVTIPCVPALTFDSTTPIKYNYKIGESKLTIPFAGSNNNDCFYTETLLDIHSAALANPIFTLVPVTLQSVTPPNIFSIDAPTKIEV